MSYAYAAEEMQETTEASQDQGVLGSLGINTSLLVFQLINFAIIACIVWFLILKPLTQKMGERQKLIDDSIEKAKKIDENLQKSEEKYQEKIDTAKVEANKIIEKAALEAVATANSIKDKAKKEIEILIDQAKRNISIEKDEMVAGLRKETATLVVAALEKILSEKMTEEKDKRLVDEMIQKMK